jgi:hypothetical protein
MDCKQCKYKFRASKSQVQSMRIPGLGSESKSKKKNETNLWIFRRQMKSYTWSSSPTIVIWLWDERSRKRLYCMALVSWNSSITMAFHESLLSSNTELDSNTNVRTLITCELCKLVIYIWMVLTFRKISEQLHRTTDQVMVVQSITRS